MLNLLSPTRILLEHLFMIPGIVIAPFVGLICLLFGTTRKRPRLRNFGIICLIYFGICIYRSNTSPFWLLDECADYGYKYNKEECDKLHDKYIKPLLPSNLK